MTHLLFLHLIMHLHSYTLFVWLLDMNMWKMSDNNCEHCILIQKAEVSSTNHVDEVTYDQLLESLLWVRKFLCAAIYPVTFHQDFESLLTKLSEAGVAIPYHCPSDTVIAAVDTFTHILKDNNSILAGTIAQELNAALVQNTSGGTKA